LSKEVSVFKIAQKAKIQDDTEGQEDLFCCDGSALVYSLSPKIITANGEDEQYDEYPARFKIKKQTHRQQINGAQLIDLVNEGIKEQYH
jgi:hypothetical protein